MSPTGAPALRHSDNGRIVELASVPEPSSLALVADGGPGDADRLGNVGTGRGRVVSRRLGLLGQQVQPLKIVGSPTARSDVGWLATQHGFRWVATQHGFSWVATQQGLSLGRDLRFYPKFPGRIGGKRGRSGAARHAMAPSWNALRLGSVVGRNFRRV